MAKKSKEMTFNLSRVFKEQRAFVKERNWEQFHTIKNIAIALSVEASELLEIFTWMSDKEIAAVKPGTATRLEIEEEVADVFYWLCRLCDLLEINPEEVFFKKMKQNAKKYPVHLSKGTATKYTKLNKSGK